MPKSFKANGMVTLTTDFGLSDPYVGVMKGAILRRFSEARIVDVTHDVPAYQPQLAGFWLARAWRYFPEGTVHVAVVDPGVGTDRKMMAVIGAEQVFITPDNGLLNPVITSLGSAEVRVFSLNDLALLQLPSPSFTFHGRDIFAPLVAEIAANRFSPRTLGTTRHEPLSEPTVASHQGQVIWVDHYGNLITNIDAEALKSFKRPMLSFRDLFINIQPSYGYAGQGELLAVVNAWGVLEIAESQGYAQRRLTASLGEVVGLLETLD